MNRFSLKVPFRTADSIDDVIVYGMAGVSIKKVIVLNNPARFTDPFKFEVTYEALQDLEDGSSPSDPSRISLFSRPRMESPLP